MSEQVTGIRALIEFVLKKAGLVEAKGGVEDLVKVSTKAESSFSRMTKSINQAWGALKTYFAANVISQFLRGALTEFAKIERAWNVIGLQMKRLGIDAATELPKVKRFLEELAASGGATVAESAPAFQLFLNLTKDVESALYAVGLANDVAESQGKDLADTVDKLARLWQGSTKSATDFGLSLHKANGEKKTAKELLVELREQVLGIDRHLEDSQNEIDKFSNSWVNFKSTIGSLISPMLPNLGKALETLGAALSQFWKGRGAAVQQMEKIWSDPEFKITIPKSASGQNTFEGSAGDKGRADLKELDRERQAAADKRRKQELEELEKYLDLEYEKQQARIAAEEAAQERIKELAEKALDREKDTAARTYDLRQQLFDATIALLETGTNEWAEAQTRQIESEFQRQIVMAGTNIEQILLLYQIYARKRMAIDRQVTEHSKKLSEIERDTRISNTVEILQASSSFLSAAFGQSKSAAIAQALISEALAILRIWEKHSDNPYLAAALTALTVATTQIQIRRIRQASAQSGGASLTSGRGFDDPANDRLVYQGSRRWALDQVRLMQMGFGDVWRDLMQAGPTSNTSNTSIDNNNSVTVHLHGRIIRAERDLRDLHRDLRRVGRKDDQARVIR